MNKIFKQFCNSIKNCIIPPYCFATRCIGEPKEKIISKFKSCDLMEIKENELIRLEFRVMQSTIVCEIQDGICKKSYIFLDT